MVDKIEAPDPQTVVFRLKFPTSAFLPALADPYTWIYKKEILDKDPRWYEKNIMGSGPFKFVSYEAGQSIKGERNPDYYHQGLPYLDGIVGDPGAEAGDPARRDPRRPRRDRVPRLAALGARRTGRARSATRSRCRTATGIAALIATPNHKKKPFDDVRVRRALTLAIDRWHGAPALSKIAIMRTVGGIVFPGSPLAATKEELQQIAGYWPDIEKSRAEAKRLLKEAGAEGLSFELLNRNVDQPFKYLGTWLVDEWSKIGLKVTQRVVPTGPWFEALRSGNFDVGARGQLPERRQPGARRQQYLPHFGLHRELRTVRGPEGDRALSNRCCTRPTRRNSAR